MICIKTKYPLIENTEFSLFKEHRISKHGNADITIYRVEFSDGRYFCFSTFESAVDFIKLNLNFE